MPLIFVFLWRDVVKYYGFQTDMLFVRVKYLKLKDCSVSINDFLFFESVAKKILFEIIRTYNQSFFIGSTCTTKINLTILFHRVATKV